MGKQKNIWEERATQVQQFLKESQYKKLELLVNGLKGRHNTDPKEMKTHQQNEVHRLYVYYAWHCGDAENLFRLQDDITKYWSRWDQKEHAKKVLDLLHKAFPMLRREASRNVTDDEYKALLRRTIHVLGKKPKDPRAAEMGCILGKLIGGDADDRYITNTMMADYEVKKDQLRRDELAIDPDRNHNVGHLAKELRSNAASYSKKSDQELLTALLNHSDAVRGPFLALQHLGSTAGKTLDPKKNQLIKWLVAQQAKQKSIYSCYLRRKTNY